MKSSNENAPNAANGAIKDPSRWVTGDEPMTGAQESYLHTLARQAGREEEVGEDLSKAQASEMIDELRHETGKDETPAASPPAGAAKAKPKVSKSKPRAAKRST